MIRICWTCEDNETIAYDLEISVYSVDTLYAKDGLLTIKEDLRIYVTVISITKDDFDIETAQETGNITEVYPKDANNLANILSNYVMTNAMGCQIIPLRTSRDVYKKHMPCFIGLKDK